MGGQTSEQRRRGLKGSKLEWLDLINLERHDPILLGYSLSIALGAFGSQQKTRRYVP